MRPLLTLLSIAFVSQPLLAQAPPRISLVQPAGGKAGTTVSLVVAGQDLDGVDGLYFSFPGAKVETLGAEKLPDVTPKKGAPKMAAGGPKTALRFQVTLPPDAPLGIHDIRLIGKSGASNPRGFVVGDFAEMLETEPNDDVPQANKVPLGVTIGGVIDKATDVDYFQFAGKKGDRVVVSCLTTSIESRLQASVEIYTSAGKLLASNRNYQNNDAVTDAVLPNDGDYLVRLSSFTHTLGGLDYNYRLTIGLMPWIDAVIPAAVEPGKDTEVNVYGRNLPGGVDVPNLLLDGRPLQRIAMTVKADAEPKARQRLTSRTLMLPAMSALDGFDLRLSSPHGSSNPYFVALAKSPVGMKPQPLESSKTANEVSVPGQVSGCIAHKGGVDWYRFAAMKGVPLAIELFADRLNPAFFSPAVDLKFVVTGPKGNGITTQDDNPEIMANQFFARSEDPARYRLVPTEDGEYRVGVSSSDGSFSPRHVYSLRIAPEDGDFRIVAMPLSPLGPDSATTAAEGNYAFNAFVWRLGNFTGDVTIRGGKLPPGVSVKPQVISATQKQAAVVVSVAADAPAYTGPIELEATATADGQKLVREVRSATITYPVTQVGQPMLARLDREMILSIRGRAQYALIPSTDKISIVQGDKIVLSVKHQPLNPDFKGTVQVSAVALPLGMALAPTTVGDKDVALPLDAKTTALPGNYTLVLRGQTQPINNNKPPAKGAPPNIVEHSPPIQLTIIPKQLLKVTPPTTPIKLARGKSADVSIQLTRLFPFDGPLDIELASGPKEISLTPFQAKGDETALEMTFRADVDAPLGNAPLVLRITARFNDLRIPHEVKMTIAVTK